MLDTFMVLVLLGALAVLGCLMGFFGGRYFRPFSFLIGLCGGVLSVIFLISRLASNISLTSMPAIIAAGGVGVLLGVLSMVFRFIGLAITGIAAGLVAGTGIVFCADFLLGGLIPPIVYTFISVLIASIIALSCLARPNTGKAFSTSVLGGFAAVTAIAMVVAWFASQRGELAQLLASSESLFTDISIIYTAMSDKTLALYVVSCLLLGIAMFALQSPYIEQTETEPGIDEMDEPFEPMKEAAPIKERRKKREPKEKRPKKKRQKRRFSEDTDFSEEYDDYDIDEFDDEYDEDYAELDAMIEQGVDSTSDLEMEEQPQTDSGQTDGSDMEETGEIAFKDGKKTLTADGREQPAHGPLRPRSMPDENGFVEKAVTVQPGDVEEPTVVFQPILDEDERQQAKPRVAKPSRKSTSDDFSSHKPTFKREKTLSEEMDYKPQGGFASRSSRKKKR